MPSRGSHRGIALYALSGRSARSFEDLLTNQRWGLEPRRHTVNMIYRHSTRRPMADGPVPRDASHLAYSLFYRSRKHVRQLKDSLDLLRGWLERVTKRKGEERGDRWVVEDAL
ncbi:hypothetical protein WN51_10830 [Melipona quadrifasciata]|uniref:Uncharacterized protein n=1 Tax=Melipona quadrifasciata TaxID=166423 RepID=A0A0N1ITT4_9HYME|nr:hypothetical protein WN51_10830 [Melipona quadrifasciata]